MLIKIEGLLSTADVQRIRELLAKSKFEDGRTTAGVAVRDVKKNLQVNATDEGSREARQIVAAALVANETFNQRALPHHVLPPMFNRYDASMEYGSHVDNAIMGVGGEPLRADLSVTVFLTDPVDYDGGELIINTDGGATQSVKMAAGGAVIYSSTSIHRVTPVTRGSRVAAVTWVQSLVRDEARREMLMELMEAARWARSVAPGSLEAMRLSKIRANLMRMWSEV